MLKALNATFLALIPKKEGANSLNSFIPIALCNAMYKIITKVIVERLKPWISNLISEDQGGFVTEIIFLDGVIIVVEVFHSMATSKEKSMFIKLDMEKAYDRARWSFLQKVL